MIEEAASTMQREDIDPHESEWPPEGLERAEHCPVCASSDRRVLYEGLTDCVFFCAPGEWTIYRCRSCGSAYLDPRPTESMIHLAYRRYYTHSKPDTDTTGSLDFRRYILRSLANGYCNRRYGTDKRPANALGYYALLCFPARRAAIDAAMRHLPPPESGARVLDVGCGSGVFLRQAHAMGWHAVGIDPDYEAVCAAQGQGLDVRHGDIGCLNPGEESFNGVTLCHVIEHVHDPNGVIRACYRLLQPGGWIWVETPNIDALGRKRYGAIWRGLEPPRHLSIFSRAALWKVLEEAGFVDIEDLPFRCLYAGLAKKSEALQRGDDPYAVRPTVWDRIVAMPRDIEGWCRPNIREFVALKARKPA